MACYSNAELAEIEAAVYRVRIASLRAEIAELRAEVASLKAALAVRADNDRLIREFSEQRESDEQQGLSGDPDATPTVATLPR